MTSRYLLFICIFLFSYIMLAQNNTNFQIDYPQNVNSKLTKTELKMIKDVYQSKTDELVLNNESFLKDIKHLIRNRVLIYEELDTKKQKKTKLLSQVPLFNEHNLQLKRDESFDIKTFNPLKYKLDFFANGTYVYQIDNTNYFIQITSQHRKVNK